LLVPSTESLTTLMPNALLKLRDAAIEFGWSMWRWYDEHPENPLPTNSSPDTVA
jgi:hypothetical protein